MTDKPLHSASSHCSDEQLLLHIDSELPARDSGQVRDHLAVCPGCRARMAEIESALADFTQTYRRSSTTAMDASGPRALLKARLAEQSRSSHAGFQTHLRYLRGFAYACALTLMVLTGVAVYRHQAAGRINAYARMLPDPGFTPGSTREVALADLCSIDRDEVVRNVPDPLQKKVFQEYGIRGVPATDFEVDYLITPGLGGSDDVRNLWPEPHSNTAWNSYVKDQLEDHLHRMVCERKISLSEAQRDIASNWIAAYKKYFHTDKPLVSPLQAGLPETAHRDVVHSEVVHLGTALRRKQRWS
jgi:hypothetical protein